MSFTNDITDQYLSKVYDDLQREQTKLMNELKNTNGVEEKNKERDLTKQISSISTLSLNVLKLKNLRTKIKNDV